MGGRNKKGERQGCREERKEGGGGGGGRGEDRGAVRAWTTDVRCWGEQASGQWALYTALHMQHRSDSARYTLLPGTAHS